MSAPSTVSYRKTKANEWVAFGPVSLIPASGPVTVYKKNGEAVNETIRSRGNAFSVEGVSCCYGYLAPKATVSHKSSGFIRRNSGETKVCWECGCRFTYGDCRANDGDWSESYCGC